MRTLSSVSILSRGERGRLGGRAVGAHLLSQFPGYFIGERCANKLPVRFMFVFHFLSEKSLIIGTRECKARTRQMHRRGSSLFIFSFFFSLFFFLLFISPLSSRLLPHPLAHRYPHPCLFFARRKVAFFLLFFSVRPGRRRRAY